MVAHVFVSPSLVVEVGKYDLAAVERLEFVVPFAWLVGGLNIGVGEFVFGGRFVLNEGGKREVGKLEYLDDDVSIVVLGFGLMEFLCSSGWDIDGGVGEWRCIGKEGTQGKE